MVLFTRHVSVTPAAPEEASARHASSLAVSSVIDVALASVPSTPRQQATRLLEVLAQRGIAKAWQLAALRDSELAELAIDAAGWNLGELMALRVAVARIPAVPPMPLPDATGDAADINAGEKATGHFEHNRLLSPKLRSLLNVPESASQGHMKAFSKSSRSHNFFGFCAPQLAMPASQVRQSVLFNAQHSCNTTAILTFVLWQFRLGTDSTDGYGSLPQITNLVIALGVLTLLMSFAGASTLTWLLGIAPAEVLEANVNTREAVVRYQCNCFELGAIGQYSLVLGVVLHAWGTLPMWFALAVTVALAILWVVTAPWDNLLLTCLHPIGVLHAPKSLLASMGISVNDAVVKNAKIHRDALLALVVGGWATRGTAK